MCRSAHGPARPQGSLPLRLYPSGQHPANRHADPCQGCFPLLSRGLETGHSHQQTVRVLCEGRLALCAQGPCGQRCGEGSMLILESAAPSPTVYLSPYCLVPVAGARRTLRVEGLSL